MSTPSNENSSAFDSKMQKLTDHLRKKILTPAEKERDSIVADAKQQAETIIAQARKEADAIIAEAEKKARETERNMQSNLKVAAHKSVDTLKLALEKEVLNKVIDTPVKEMLTKAELVAAILKEALTALGADIEGELILSEPLKTQLAATVSSLLTQGITLSDATIPNGFKVVVKNSDLSFDFTEETVSELLQGFLRKEIRTVLFS